MKPAHKKSPVLTMSCDVPQVELEPSRVTGLFGVSTTAVAKSRRTRKQEGIDTVKMTQSSDQGSRWPRAFALIRWLILFDGYLMNGEGKQVKNRKMQVNGPLTPRFLFDGYLTISSYGPDSYFIASCSTS